MISSRVPQILAHVGVLEYSESLKEKVRNKEVIDHASEEEIEIRAATVEWVERLKDKIAETGKQPLSIELDWILWQMGEEKIHEIEEHHRTLSIFY